VTPFEIVGTAVCLVLWAVYAAYKWERHGENRSLLEIWRDARHE